MKAWTAILAVSAVFGLSGCEQLLDMLYGDPGGGYGPGCPDVYEPVCGTDGLTYGNECDAHVAGVRVMHEGTCEGCEYEDCIVCDDDGCYGCEYSDCGGCGHYDWPTRCGGGGWGGSGGVEPPWEPGDCACTDDWSPVCGPDGMVYPNRCHARCMGETDVVPCEE